MKLADNIVFLANIGYGYFVTDVRCVATHYARFLGNTVNAKGMLSSDRFYGFIKRWTQLKAVKPHNLGQQRANIGSKDNIGHFFETLGNLHRENLLDAPERIWNVEKSGISTEHSPPRSFVPRSPRPKESGGMITCLNGQ